MIHAIPMALMILYAISILISILYAIPIVYRLTMKSILFIQFIMFYVYDIRMALLDFNYIHYVLCYSYNNYNIL